MRGEQQPLTVHEVSPVCDIVIPIWNQPELTARCLESLERCAESPARLILVDNASETPTRELLERARDRRPDSVRILRNATNLGFIKAVNQGIRVAVAPWVCILNNDTVVNPGWLSEMLKVAQADPAIGLVNPTSNSLGFQPPKSKTLEEYAASLRPQSGASTELATALGFCLLARRDLFENIGLLDESYGMGNFDDDDLSRRVRQAGYRCARACASYVHHEEKASFRRLPGWEKAFEENRRRFQQRWGRPLRILWAEGAGTVRGLLNTSGVGAASELVRQGHWISFIVPGGSLPDDILSLAQVHQLPVPASGWRMRATLRLLAKRKKPFDVVISYDRPWSRWVRRLQPLHRAVALDSPTQQEILEQCQALSRSPSSS